MKTYSTLQVARMVGIHRVTLQLWMKARKVRPSHVMKMNGGKVYVWTPADLKKVRQYKATHYWEGRGRRTSKGGPHGKPSRNPHRQ